MKVWLQVQSRQQAAPLLKQELELDEALNVIRQLVTPADLRFVIQTHDSKEDEG